MVFQITLPCYVTLLGPAMHRHCQKFMLTKIPGNMFQIILDLIIVKVYILDMMTRNALEVMTGNMKDVMTGNVIDVMTGNMLGVMTGNVLGVMSGSELDVTAGNKLEAMVGNMFRRISLFKKICLHLMQRLQHLFMRGPGTGQQYLHHKLSFNV